MDYRRLVVILILVLFIAYMNRTIREGLDSECPPGESKIDNSPLCGKPGSTLRNVYKGDINPTCKPGFTYLGGAGQCASTNENGQMIPAFGNMVCPVGTEAVVFSFPGQGRDASGNPIIQRDEKCFYPCPSGTVADGRICVPTGPSSTTPTPAAATTRSLADVNKDIDYLKSRGFTEMSENDTMKKLIAERASLGGAPPISTPAYSNAPSALANVPTPSMTCAAENFSSF